MSRHYLAHRTKKNAYFVAGYDRPLQAFYIQVWESPDDDGPVYTDDCFDLDLLGDTGAEIPANLRDILVQECLGERDPNYCHDWRKSCLPSTPSGPPGDTEVTV